MVSSLDTVVKWYLDGRRSPLSVSFSTKPFPPLSLSSSLHRLTKKSNGDDIIVSYFELWLLLSRVTCWPPSFFTVCLLFMVFKKVLNRSFITLRSKLLQFSFVSKRLCSQTSSLLLSFSSDFRPFLPSHLFWYRIYFRWGCQLRRRKLSPSYLCRISLLEGFSLEFICLMFFIFLPSI